MRNIAENFKECKKDMPKGKQKDTEAYFYSGVLLGISYIIDGLNKENAGPLIEEIEKKLEITSD